MTPRPPCEYQPACPGCPRFGKQSLPEPATRKLRELLKRFDGPELVEQSCEGIGYRHRSRLSVRGRVGDIKLGIFEAGSHRLVHIPRCPVHHPAIVRLSEVLVQQLNELEVLPYDEVGHCGQLRALQFAVQPDTGGVQLGLLVLSEQLSLETLSPNLKQLAARLSGHTESLFFGSLPQKNNSLFAKQWLHISGPSMMTDWVGGQATYFPPDAFGQANPKLHERAVAMIHSMIEPADRVIEYYSGVGTIGLGLVPRVRSVTFNEIGEGSLSGLKRGLRELPGQSKILAGPAGNFADVYTATDTVIVDPPRKGLDGPLFARFLREPPKRLIYLSCGLAALLREAEELLETGLYTLEHASAWAYFPFTEHIESLLVFSRAHLNPTEWRDARDEQGAART